MHKHIRIFLILLILAWGLTACAVRERAESKSVEMGEEGPVPESSETPAAIPGEWITNYEKALSISQETGKPILVNFTGSDWCIWCVRLKDEVFDKQEFTDYAAANLVLLTLDFPRDIAQSEEEKKQNTELAEKYAIEGYPTILLLNSEGVELNRTGYRQGGAAAYVEHLKGLLK